MRLSKKRLTNIEGKMPNKIAIVVGHHKFSKGAKSSHLLSEYDLMSEVAENLKDVADVFYHNPKIGGYNSRQKAMGKKTSKYKIVFELHYNAATPQANGCEALYYFSNNEGKAIAEEFCLLVNSKMGIKNRGAKALHSENQRGFGFVYNMKGTAIILEPFFGTSWKDVTLFDKKMYADLLRQFIKTL